MYQSLYNLINNLVFSGSATPMQEEVITLFATGASLFVVCLPIWLICKVLGWTVGSWR